MHHTANFRCGQSTRSLLNDFKGQRQGEGAITLHAGFERFAFDKFHRVKTFTVLLTVMRHACNVGMMNFCGCAGFTQKTRTGGWIFCELSTDYLERDSRIKNSVSSAVSYRHGSGAKYYR